MSVHEPSLQPPTEKEAMKELENCPVGMPPASDLSASAAANDTNDEVPTDEPPADEAAATTTDAFAAATWHVDKKVQSLFGTQLNRNSWIYPTGLGWKKLADNSDSASVALTILASHARELNRNVKIKEDGGKITEMYVW